MSINLRYSVKGAPELALRIGQAARNNPQLRVACHGGELRDRRYFVHSLASELGYHVVELSWVTNEDETDAMRKQRMKHLLNYAEGALAILYLDDADRLRTQPSSRRRTADAASYFTEALESYAAPVILAFTSDEPNVTTEVVAFDFAVRFPSRAPNDSVVLARRLPISRATTTPLPGFHFGVQIGDQDIGLCQVSSVMLGGGFMSGEGFNHEIPVDKLPGINPEALAVWPTVSLRRAMTQSKILYTWREALQDKKKLDLRPVTIEQYDASGRNIVNTFRLENCWPKRWSGPTFDALAHDLSFEELELYYLRVRWR